MSWVLGNLTSFLSLPPAQRQPLRLAAARCACNGLCSIFATEENLRGLQSGKTLECATGTVQDVEAWSLAGCPLAKFLLSPTVGAGLEKSVAMQPWFFKLMVWHKGDLRSGLRHQAIYFEIPDSDQLKAVSKCAEIYAVPGSPSARFLKSRPADPDLGSNNNFDLVKSWIRDCAANHPECHGNGAGRMLPTRVIEVLPPSPSGADMVRIRASDGQEPDARYAALSYCWGKQQTCISTTASLVKNAKEIPLSSVHGTVRDAVLTTRNLGIPYLWVDALCIIQDSDDDKAAEIAKMGDVYANATLTISAAGARDCDAGFLTKRKDVGERYDQRSQELDYICPDDTLGRVYLVPIGHDDVNDENPEIIYERAWTHQERMLSPRLLTFGKRKLSWQCLTSSHCDFDIEEVHFGSATLDVRKFLHGITGAPENAVLHDWWREVVHGYSQGRLSVLGDKLAAISATARRFAAALQSQYVHGLWGDDLVRDMMWYSSRPLRIRYPDHFRRPGLTKSSWSWASINGPVAYPQVYLAREPMITATASYTTVDTVPDLSFSDSFHVYMRLQGSAHGPFTLERLKRHFHCRTREYESEEPHGSCMGWYYPDENNELLFGGPDHGHEYWFFELSRLGRVRNGLVLRKTQDGQFKRAAFYSVNTQLPEEDQQRWESAAQSRDILLL